MMFKKYNLLIIAFFLTVLVNQAKAQYYYSNTFREDTWRLTAGANILYRQNPPTNYGAGLAGQLGLEYYPNNYVGVTLTSGFYDLFGKSINGGPKKPNFTFIPIKVGVKGFFSPKWYLAGEIGAGYANPPLGDNASHFAKTIAPAIGYNNPNTGLDISLRYENVHHQNDYISMIALQIAYSFDISDVGY